MAVKTESPGSPSLRKRKKEETTNNATEGSEEQPKFTDEQLQAVEKIRKCKDYYEILGLTKDAGESDLRKQYKRLALQFHPDKNKAPGAVEAFKAIGNAFSVLNDPVKRKRYDTYGLEAMQTTETHPTQEGYYTYSTFEGDITAEELYNMFFHGQAYARRGGGTHFQRFYTRQAHAQAYQEDNRSALMQILPLIFVVSVSLLSSFFVSDPPYSIQRTSKYYIERRTNSLDVPYFVQKNFVQNYEDSIQRIERQVEDEHILTMRTSCFRERNYKENMIWRAKHFRDNGLEAKAKDLRTPSCDTLNELYKLYNKRL
ncbi:hypothetical protein JTE90_007624 [Oedothorax gibbosus]|uniref:J domain-containing protein n=1 Tax=Oedothorax gibbosus TaxID=931172 RepID=A0AAV6U4D7_9ARAC|nr:hypothetical protein JTE90_007624 [Oedothorax gibbosus]